MTQYGLGKGMKILKVIHGYPMRYNAGSEVYSQMLCHGLANRHKVAVFTRQENSFMPDYRMTREQDPENADIDLHLINLPLEKHRNRYRDSRVDGEFEKCLEQFTPDIVHIGHLNHLSCSIVEVAKRRNLPIFYTLHDYWLLCPRGQFLKRSLDDQTLWSLCDGQEDSKCAKECFACFQSGAPEESSIDLSYWTYWVTQRMEYVRKIIPMIDCFVSPSKYLQKVIQEAFQIPDKKMQFLDYGFDRSRFKKYPSKQRDCYHFGYIGTHIPAKGIHHLIEAFSYLKGEARLYIWGRLRSDYSPSLKALADQYPHISSKIVWKEEYKNGSIAEDVFPDIDALVVPSIWYENSPLVIHEAQQMGVPVITAAAGGMQEYVHHQVNGLLFAHRDPQDLARQMQLFVDNPELGKQLGKRGYLYSEDGQIPDMEEHVQRIEKLYFEGRHAGI